MEFFREAPTVSIVLVVLGAFVVIVLSTGIQVRAVRRRQAIEKLRSEGGPPVLVRDGEERRVRYTELAVRAAGYALMGIGFAIWILD